VLYNQILLSAHFVWPVHHLSVNHPVDLLDNALWASSLGVEPVMMSVYRFLGGCLISTQLTISSEAKAAFVVGENMVISTI